jgi:hypothetical protein
VAGIKGKVTHQLSGFVSPAGRQQIVYQSVQHAVPVHVQEIFRVPVSHSVSSVQNHVNYFSRFLLFMESMNSNSMFSRIFCDSNSLLS